MKQAKKKNKKSARLSEIYSDGGSDEDEDDFIRGPSGGLRGYGNGYEREWNGQILGGKYAFFIGFVFVEIY